MRGDRRFTWRSTFPVSRQQLFAWHTRPGALERLIPPWENTWVMARQGQGVEPGTRVTLHIQNGPVVIPWTARHVSWVEDERFRDIQLDGPFAYWSHSHHFFNNGRWQSDLEDEIHYRTYLPGFLAAPVEDWVQRHLRRTFASRHRTLLADLELHKGCSRKPLRILLSGASGVLGQALIPLLTTGGHEIWRLVRRRPQPGANEIYWNPWSGEIDAVAIPEVDAVIHLAGDNIGEGRWSEEKKRTIIYSRVQGTALLARTVAAMKKKPTVFVSASAIGYYGNRGENLLGEEQPAGLDFISEVCKRWELSTAPVQEAGIRCPLLRIGVVLTPKGGALQRLLPLARLGLGGRFGDGQQYLSWISIDDMAAALLHCISTAELDGPVNVAAPHPVRNADFVATLSRLLYRPALLPVPAGVIRKVFGQMGEEVLLASCRVGVDKLTASGFTFRHPDLTTALHHLLGLEDKVLSLR